MIAAGARNTLVTFEQVVTTSDEYGGEVVTKWTPLAQAWCKVRPLSIQEQMRAMQVQMPVSHELTTLWCEELRTLDFHHRINMSGRILNIVSVINKDEASIELSILAVEGVPT